MVKNTFKWTENLAKMCKNYYIHFTTYYFPSHFFVIDSYRYIEKYVHCIYWVFSEILVDNCCSYEFVPMHISTLEQEWGGL